MPLTCFYSVISFFKFISRSICFLTFLFFLFQLTSMKNIVGFCIIINLICMIWLMLICVSLKKKRGKQYWRPNWMVILRDPILLSMAPFIQTNSFYKTYFIAGCILRIVVPLQYFSPLRPQNYWIKSWFSTHNGHRTHVLFWTSFLIRKTDSLFFFSARR